MDEIKSRSGMDRRSRERRKLKAEVENGKSERNESTLAVGAPQVTPDMKKKIISDRKKHKHSVAEAYKSSQGSAEDYNKGVQDSVRKASVADAYKDSLKSAQVYNEGVQESIRRSDVAAAYQSSLDAAKKYNDEMSAAIKYPAEPKQNDDATGSRQERAAAAAKNFNDGVDAAVARPGRSIDEARKSRDAIPTGTFGSRDRLPPHEDWGDGKPGQREAGRQRPLAETHAQSEAELRPELENQEARGEPIGNEGAEVLRDAVQQAPENRERRDWWGFFKERVKGFFTFGILEFHHAEKFRSGTKKTAEEVTKRASLLQQEKDMDIDTAEEEAELIRGMAGGPNRMTKENIEAASKDIDVHKKEYNARFINQIIEQARDNVRTRLSKYRNQFGKIVVDDQRQLAQFEVRLRAELNESTIGRGIREPGAMKREIDFKKAVRERLDKNYWARYVYGAADVALWATGIHFGSQYLAQWLSSPPANWNSPTTVPSSGGESIISIPGTESIPMHDTIWKTASEWLQGQGISNPTNSQIMDISKQVALDNGIGVGEWGIPGTPLDTSMEQGRALKFVGPALKAIMASW
jgi:hypothetical protein